MPICPLSSIEDTYSVDLYIELFCKLLTEKATEVLSFVKSSKQSGRWSFITINSCQVVAFSLNNRTVETAQLSVFYYMYWGSSASGFHRAQLRKNESSCKNFRILHSSKSAYRCKLLPETHWNVWPSPPFALVLDRIKFFVDSTATLSFREFVMSTDPERKKIKKNLTQKKTSSCPVPWRQDDWNE
jgi:hypothetical protein